MNTTAAATTAGVTVATIRTWCAKGVIGAVKQAGRWVIDETSLRYRIALAALKRRKEQPVTSPHGALIRLCETQGAICAARVQELNRRGRENLGCTDLEFDEMTGAYTRAADAYTHLAGALKRGDLSAYRLLASDALASHSGAVYYDRGITGEELPPAPRRREMTLPKA